ncbi:pYEATS domain-containing protein [Ancylobacter sp.]|uniref:pYEATS domain-containing protein n=1 Tax=Ancylobacter sp. TaxID=1872567 RepID=UPI003D0B2AA0
MGSIRSFASAASAAWLKSANKPFIIIATILIIVAIAEAFGRVLGDGTKISILVGLALVTLVVPRIETFSFGSDGVKAALNRIDANNIAATSEMDVNVSQKLEQILREVVAIRQGMGTAAFASDGPGAEDGIALPEPANPDDPQKGRFGGTEASNGRILCATVEPSTLKGSWCTVTLIVRPSRNKSPVTGPVIFYLHDSFSPHRYVVTAAQGEARLVFRAYGAFTAGAIVDGSTLLELDLAESPNVDAPKEWRAR